MPRSVPFAIPVRGGVSAGKLIYIQGQVPRHADRFTINLQSTQSLSDSPRPDTSLHLSVRFHDNVVVRNTYQHDSWASEERHGGMPFHLDRHFKVSIKVESGSYKVAVDGQHFTEFRHRMAKEVGSFLRIDGSVVIHNVTFQDGGIPDNPYQPPYQPPMTYPMSSMPRFDNPMVPFNSKIGSVFPGRMVFVSGVPNYGCKSFQINLQCGLLPDANIAFHMSVRFNDAGDHNAVVRNHRDRGTWGTEIREGYFPFVMNGEFIIIIKAENHSFMVAVNNQHFTEFPYRIRPLSIVDSLVVKGEVRLSNVSVQ